MKKKRVFNEAVFATLDVRSSMMLQGMINEVRRNITIIHNDKVSSRNRNQFSDDGAKSISLSLGGGDVSQKPKENVTWGEEGQAKESHHISEKILVQIISKSKKKLITRNCNISD